MHALPVCSPDNRLASTQMWLCLIRTQINLLTLFSNILTPYIQINLTNQKKKKEEFWKMVAAVETQFCTFGISIWKHRKSLHCKTQEPWTTFNKDGWQDALQSPRISVNSFKPLTATRPFWCHYLWKGNRRDQQHLRVRPARFRTCSWEEGSPHARGVPWGGTTGWTRLTRVTSKQSGCLLELDCTPRRNHRERHQNTEERQERDKRRKLREDSLGTKPGNIRKQGTRLLKATQKQQTVGKSTKLPRFFSR